MIKDLKNEMMSFIKTLETTIKDENELQCVKEKTAHLFEVFADELEKVFKYKVEKHHKMNPQVNIIQLQ